MIRYALEKLFEYMVILILSVIEKLINKLYN